MNREQLDQLLDALWRDYLSLSPDARRIHGLLSARNPHILHDHLVLQTVNIPRVSIAQLIRPFEDAGYRVCSDYHFPVKKLFARHFEHPDGQLPKIFMIEQRIERIDAPDVLNTIHQLVSQIPDAALTRDDFWCSGRYWRIDFDTYRQLQQYSEYLAWIAAFGFRPHHFSVLLNSLEAYENIDDLNDFLLEQGFRLNTSGGLVRGTPDEYLEQSSTLAGTVEVDFSDRRAAVTGTYYEFIRRYPQPDGRLFQGFAAASTDRILESATIGPPTF